MDCEYTDQNDNRVKILAEQLIRAARLEYLGAPPRIMRREYEKISNRLFLIDLTKDAGKLLEAIDEVLLKNITMNLSGTSCLNCVTFHDCPKGQEAKPQTGSACELAKPYPYDDDARILCSGYQADWDKFDEAEMLSPEILIRLETVGIPLDRNRIAGKILAVMGRWVKAVRT